MGAWFRVSAWRVGAWARGCPGVFFVFPVCLCFFEKKFFFDYFLSCLFFHKFKKFKKFKNFSKTSGEFLVLSFYSKLTTKS